MKETHTSTQGEGQYYGQMVGESRIQRLDARSIKDTVSVGFSSNF